MTSGGESITVIHPGRLNNDAGPDFQEARIKIGDTLLVGHVEMHVNASDWYKHAHQHDAAYANVILHVVYNNDFSEEGQLKHIPTLQLAGHIPTDIISRYTNFVARSEMLPCAGQISQVRDITKEAWLGRLLAERWEEKLVSWKELLDESKNDWRNLLYWRMAANFGFKVNADPFLMMARATPLNVFAKHANSLLQTEAILFGQAGLLSGNFKDEYPNTLQKEYNYLKAKYKLQPIAGHLWKFLRMRPANFPIIRIAQFAQLLHRSVHLFADIIEAHSPKEMYPLLDVEVSEYWQGHYVFDELSETKTKKRLGKASIENIVINTIAPIRFLYASKLGEQDKQETALQLLDALPPESNNIISRWSEIGWKPLHAAQSQALIQLYNNYCTPRRCLDCAIGHSLIKAK